MITSQAEKLSTGAGGKVVLMALLACLGLAACNKEVILEGTRFPVRAPLADSVPVEGQPAPVPPLDGGANQTAPISLPAALANADWPQRGGSVRHFGPHGALSAVPQLVWTVSIGAGNSKKNRINAAPVVAGGVVFVMDALSGVTAVSTQGAKLWHADLTAGFDNGGGVSGGGLAVDGARLYATTGYGETIALNLADGAIVWRQRLGSMPTGAPAVAGDAVYVVGGSVFVANDEGRLVRLNAQDGHTIWAVDLPYFTKTKPKKLMEITASFGPVLAGGHLVGGSSDGPLRLFNPTDGSLAGQVALPGGAATPPALAQGMVFVVNTKGQLLAFR